VAFSVSGITIDQLEAAAPEVLDSFRRLAHTGAVDFLTETYYHSLSCLMPGNEFELQVAKHQKRILREFGVMSKVFRNTELIYSDETGKRISRLGFKGTLVDGIDRVLAGRPPHQLYTHSQTDKLKLLTRNYRLSDDIAFRFSQGPDRLTPVQYLRWLDAIPADQEVIHLGMDYETFGEHHKNDSGILNFLETLLSEMARSKQYRFMTPSEAIDQFLPTETLLVPGYISWADQERDVSAWLGNEMQRDAFDSLIKLEGDVKTLLDKTLLDEWRALQTSDHFYYMSTKKGSDGQVHSYFSPYPSPYEAFINYMNVLTDFALKVKKQRPAVINEDIHRIIPVRREQHAALRG
jgi:alpha-amylase